MRNKSKLFLIAALAVLSILPLLAYLNEGDSLGPPSFSLDKQEALQASLESAVKELSLPGAVVGITGPDGGVWTGVCGLAKTEKLTGTDPAGWSGRPMTADEVFPVGDVAKTFTATVILRLAQDGVLGLDDSVEDWLPGTAPGGRLIRIVDLLNMSSGLYDFSVFESGLESSRQDPSSHLSAGELLAMSNEMSGGVLKFDPGQDWDYCQVNYVLLGLIAEKATGRKMRQLLSENVIVPLGLKNTYVGNPGDGKQPPAHGYQHARNGSWHDCGDSAAWSSPDGDELFSSSGDLMLWLKAMLDGRLLKETFQQRMFDFQAVETGREGYYYGLGVEMKDGWVGHFGARPGYACALYRYNGYDFVVLVNTDAFSCGGIDPAWSLMTRLSGVLLT